MVRVSRKRPPGDSVTVPLARGENVNVWPSGSLLQRVAVSMARGVRLALLRAMARESFRMGRGSSRARGEGNTEYVILLLFVLICAVCGLFTSYSSTIKKMQLEKGLCLDCTTKDTVTPNSDPNASPTSSGPPPSTTTPDPSNNTNNNAPAGPPLASSTADLPAAPPPDDLASWWQTFQAFLAWW